MNERVPHVREEWWLATLGRTVVWARLRVREADGRTVVAAAALARGDDAGLADELDRVMTAGRALQGPGEADA